MSRDTHNENRLVEMKIPDLLEILVDMASSLRHPHGHENKHLTKTRIFSTNRVCFPDPAYPQVISYAVTVTQFA